MRLVSAGVAVLAHLRINSRLAPALRDNALESGSYTLSSLFFLVFINRKHRAYTLSPVEEVEFVAYMV